MLLLRLFKNNRTGGIAFVVFLSLLTCLVSFIRPGESAQGEGMPIYNLLFGELYRFPRLSIFVALLFHLAICFILNRMNTRYSLIEERTYMPAIFYLLIVNAFPSLHSVNPMLIGGLFYLLSFNVILDSHNDKPDTYRVFNAFLLFFAGTLFYAKLIWFLPVFWLVLITIRPATWREVVYPIVAGLFLGILLFTYYWVFENAGWRFSELLREQLSFSGEWKNLHFSNYIYIGYIFLLVIISSMSVIRRYQAKKIIIRNIYRVLLYMFLFSFIFYFAISRYQQGTIYFTAIPLTFLLTNFFHQKKKRFVKEILILGLLGLIVYVQIASR